MSILPYVVSFSQADDYNHESIGDYALGIAKLHGGGFPVPPGFIVTRAAYDAFLREHGLEATIAGILGDIEFENADSVDEASGRIVSLLQTRSVPREVARAVHDAYSSVTPRANKGKVVLRGDGYSGEILGENDLTEKIKTAWGRNFETKKLISPLIENGGIGLVIQMIPEGENNGVGFIEKDKRRVVIEDKNGDKFVFDAQDLDLIESQSSEEAEAKEWAGRLAQSVHMLGEQYYFPMEVDWVLSGGDIYFLGSREFFGKNEEKAKTQGKKVKKKSEKYSKKLSDMRVRTATRVWVATDKLRNIEQVHADGVLLLGKKESGMDKLEVPVVWLHSKKVFLVNTPEKVVNIESYLDGKETVILDIDKLVMLAMGVEYDDFEGMAFPGSISRWVILRTVKKAHGKGVKVFLYGQRLVFYDELVEMAVRGGVSGLAVDEKILARVRRVVYETEREMIF